VTGRSYFFSLLGLAAISFYYFVEWNYPAAALVSLALGLLPDGPLRLCTLALRPPPARRQTEVVFSVFEIRGLLQANSPKEAPAWFVIGAQAILFGTLHFKNAFPQGWLGVFLTGIWGAAIATQYRLFRSIALAWVTHAVADAVMFAIILSTRT
jgi:hypothetical protein